MRRRGVSMRWWLALAFAAIASLTALAVAQVFTSRAEEAFRSRARELATGNAVAAASEVAGAEGTAELRRLVAAESDRRRAAIFVFDRDGRLLTPERSRATTWAGVPFRGQALDSALQGRRFVDTQDGGRLIVVGLPLRGDPGRALVAVASRPDLVAELGILRDELVRAVLIAVAAGATVGLLIALLIAARLRRIATVAARIEQGSFDAELRPWFGDELGDLAASVDRMRGRLRDSFSELQAERDRLRMLLEQLNEGVIAVDRTLTIAFANAAARELLSGQELAEGAPLPEPWPQLELRGLANRLFLEGASVGQARVAPGDGRTFALAGIPAGRGSRLAVVVITDVSERERRERAEREFVANAAHELRTPITAIGNALDALELGALDVPEDREKFLGVVRRQSDRLGRLVRALLVLARAQTRQEPLRLEAVQVRPLLEEAASMLDTAEGVHPEIDCPPGVWVLAQRDLVGQVVANLASNAAKHTRRGRIVLAAANGPGDAVTLEVRDTGGGVPPHERARIFDRFYSSDGDQREGFGLGLAIVREAVRALGGVVDVTSTAQGTTVRVTLASARKEAA